MENKEMNEWTNEHYVSVTEVCTEQQQRELKSIQSSVNRVQQLPTDTKATRLHIQTTYNGPQPISHLANYHTQFHYFQLRFHLPIFATILFIHGEEWRCDLWVMKWVNEWVVQNMWLGVVKPTAASIVFRICSIDIWRYGQWLEQQGD
jgi:DNA segregation ATPase FtsK/SpoIIIE-like protein